MVSIEIVFSETETVGMEVFIMRSILYLDSGQLALSHGSFNPIDKIPNSKLHSG